MIRQIYNMHKYTNAKREGFWGSGLQIEGWERGEKDAKGGG